MAQRKLASERWKILRNAILTAKSNPSGMSPAVTAGSIRSFSSFNLFNVSRLSTEKLSEFLPSTDNVSVGIHGIGPSEWILYSTQCHADDDISETNRSTSYPTNNMTLSNSRFPDDAHTHCTTKRLAPKSNNTQAIVKYVTNSTTREAMVGFNNTGNVCVWPSEEILAYYCLKHCELFRGTTVCELGCGMTGLAGIMLANTRLPSQVLLTDGNSTSIENVKVNIVGNERISKDVTVSAEVLLWETSFIESTSPHDSKFDYVICADCLFFETVHQELVQVILKLLKPNGRALMFAPTRGGTLEKFCSVAKRFCKVERTDNYDSVVWEKHLHFSRQQGEDYDRYQTDLHYPLMLELHKSSQ